MKSYFCFFLCIILCITVLTGFCGSAQKLNTDKSRTAKPKIDFSKDPYQYTIDTVRVLCYIDSRVVKYAEFTKAINSQTARLKKAYNPKGAIEIFGEKARGGVLIAETLNAESHE